ncbi:hypothetical protein ACE1EB_004419 [Salmonella enterica]
METETIGEFVASDGKNYLFFTDRIRKLTEEKKTLKRGSIFIGKQCRSCGGTERYSFTGNCVTCTRKTSRAYHEKQRLNND